MAKAKVRQSRASKSELVRLRARLAEAEDTLNAIRKGEVDAIAVDGPHGRQIFTLQSAEQPYRLLAERMNEGAATLTAEGIILFCNPRLAEMAGVSPERLLGSSLSSLLRAEAQENFPELVRQALKKDVRAEGHLLRNDGTTLPVQLSLSSIPLEGSEQGICLVATDLSSQKLAENAARQSENLSRTLLESLPQMIFAKDRNSRYLRCNENFAKLLGIRSEEFPGKTDYDFFNPALAEKYRADDQRVMQSGVTEEIVEEYKRDGQTMIVQTLKAPFRNAAGETIGVLGVFFDVTARKQAENKLREQAALLDLAHDAILFRGLDSRILLWNRGAKDLYGWSAEEALGKVAHELLQTEFPDSLEAIQTCIQQTREWEGELTNISRDGKAIVVASRWSLLRDEKGNPTAILEINRDISERKRVEEELRTASLYTRSLIEASLDPLVTISREGKITDVNEATEKVTGVSRERLIGSDFSSYFTDPESARRGYEQVFAQGSVQDYPLAIRSTAGKVTDVLYNATVFKNEAGEVAGVFAAARDVTERKQAEEKLRVASLYTRSLIEASLDPLVTISREGKITDVNEATEKVTGASREQLIGSDFSNYFTDPESARRGYEQVFGEGSVQDYPLVIRHVSGKLTDVLYNATVFKNEAGEVEGVFAAARDITEKKRAQEAVAAEREKFNNILDVLPPYVVLLTPDYHVAFANHEFKKRFGESNGRRCFEFLFGRSEPCKICETYKVLEAKKPLDWKWTGPDGSHYDIYDFPFIDTDGSSLILEMGIDVTERRRAEEEIRKLNAELDERVRRRTAELEAANKELEAFTYSVSHDLRAPLRHISGFSKILAEEYGSTLPTDAQHHLQRIQEGTRRMGLLVDDLLNLARVGRRDLSLRVAGLKSLVDEVIVELAPECAGREIEWKIGSLPFVECDPGLIKQVFQNLLSNAVKFTRPRPQAIVEVGQMNQAGTPVVFVRDNGVGFSMKYADKLFGVFQRLHRPEDFEGTGVGLATVQRIVQKHGGRIWVEAEPDKGATFYFTFGASEKIELKAKAAVVGDPS